MNGKVSRRDYETLSEYLDGRLGERERIQLKNRLKLEKGLQDELTAIRRTRIILRNQPRLRAPRNFTLTPQMAGVQAQSYHPIGAFQALRLASVLASFFFVITLAGFLVGGALQPRQIASSDLPQAAFLPGIGMGGGGETSPREIPQLQEEAAVESNAVRPTEAPSLKAIPREEAAQAEPALQMAPPSIAENEAASSAPDLGSSDAQPVEQPAERSLSEPVQSEAQSGVSLVLILLIALGVLAIGTGLGAVYLRKSAF